MTSQAKLTVDFRPAKRIKKRRELDALVNSKQRSLARSGAASATAKTELLRNESETSETEEFDVPAKVFLPKRGHSCSCSACFRLGCGVLLAACIVSTSVLIWMYVQLRRDVTDLQSKLTKAEDVSSRFAGQLHGLSSVQRDFSQRIQQLNDNLDDVRVNISAIVSQVNAFDGSLRILRREVTQREPVLSPSSPNEIAGKTKHLVKDDLEEEAEDEVLLEQLSPKFSWLEKKLSLLNATIHRRLEDMKAHSALVDVSLSGLSNYTQILNKRVRFVEFLPGGASRPSSDELYRVVDRILQGRIGKLNATIDAISDKLDAVLSSVRELHNSTDSNIKMLNLTAHELSAKLKLIEVTVHMMLSDSIASEATPGGKADPHPPLSSSTTKPLPDSSSYSTKSHMKNQMKTVLGSLPRS